MYGMDQETGKPINGISHLDQSIRKILTTRLGVSVMNRSFGSNLADLIDSPGNDFAKLEITAAVAGALPKKLFAWMEDLDFKTTAGAETAFDARTLLTLELMQSFDAVE